MKESVKEFRKYTERASEVLNAQVRVTMETRDTNEINDKISNEEVERCFKRRRMVRH